MDRQTQIEAEIREHNKQTSRLQHLSKVDLEIRECMLGMLELEWEKEEFLRAHRMAFLRTKKREIQRVVGEYINFEYKPCHNWENVSSSYFTLLHKRYEIEMQEYQNRIQALQEGSMQQTS